MTLFQITFQMNTLRHQNIIYTKIVITNFPINNENHHLCNSVKFRRWKIFPKSLETNLFWIITVWSKFHSSTAWEWIRKNKLILFVPFPTFCLFPFEVKSQNSPLEGSTARDQLCFSINVRLMWMKALFMAKNWK